MGISDFCPIFINKHDSNFTEIKLNCSVLGSFIDILCDGEFLSLPLLLILRCVVTQYFLVPPFIDTLSVMCYVLQVAAQLCYARKNGKPQGKPERSQGRPQA